MQELRIVRPKDERDRWMTVTLLGLACLLIVSSYLYRFLIIDQQYERSTALTPVPTLVFTDDAAS